MLLSSTASCWGADMDRASLENAILALARDPRLLEQVRANPDSAAAMLGVEASWATAILTGDRDRLRSAGVNDGITILVSR